jgi:AcrR family transcriptional regulator
MATKGYDGTSVADLVQESGLSPTSIYWHFGSKEGVLLALIERQQERVIAQTGQDHVDGADPPDRLRQALRGAGHLLRDDPMFRLTMMLQLEITTGPPDRQEALRRVFTVGRRAGKEMLCGVFALRGEQRANQIAEQLGDIMQALLLGALVTSLINPNQAVDDLMDGVADAILALEAELE